MGTRATYEFVSEDERSHTIYIHWDGYPSGAVEYFEKWNEWHGQRDLKPANLEPGCAALSFAAANKNGIGGVYSSHGWEEHRGDIEWHYRVFCRDTPAIEVFKVSFEGDMDSIWNGTLEAFIEARGEIEAEDE